MNTLATVLETLETAFGPHGQNNNIVGELLDHLAGLQTEEARTAALNGPNCFLVKFVGQYYGNNRIIPIYEPSATTRKLIEEILSFARLTGNEVAVAHYLVGAVLVLRFPNVTVPNECYSMAALVPGGASQFRIEDTVLHVTLAPGIQVYEKCKKNVESGLRVYLIVPDRVLFGARQNVDLIIPGKVAVESLESFIGQNVEEMSAFSQSQIRTELRKLFELYNKRVDEISPDKSLMIEIPPNL